MRSLEALGVDVVFGYPGGAILPAYDPLIDAGLHRTCSSGTSRAPSTWPRATPTPPVGSGSASSRPGPAATNLVTGLADAHMDSLPILAITGQVATTAIGSDAFQEADVTGITMPITKHNELVYSAERIAGAIAEAYHIARSGRPGPVLVDLPKDVLNAKVAWRWPDQPRPARLPADGPRARQDDPRGARPHRGRRPARDLRRRRSGPRRRRRGAARVRRDARPAGRHHADGPRDPARTPTSSPSACPACTATTPR